MRLNIFLYVNGFYCVLSVRHFCRKMDYFVVDKVESKNSSLLKIRLAKCSFNTTHAFYYLPRKSEGGRLR